MSVSPLSSVVAFCVEKTTTQEELDAFNELIHAKSMLLKNIKRVNVITSVISTLHERLPEFKDDIIPSIGVHQQDDTYRIIFCATIDSVPYFFWRSHDGDLRCSPKWISVNAYDLEFEDGWCKTKSDCSVTIPKRFYEFLSALQKKKIDIGAECEAKLKMQK